MTMTAKPANNPKALTSNSGLRVPALIMAGGKGKRLGLSIEKPLLPLLGKPLICWVMEAVKSANMVSEFYVVTSENTPETEKKCVNDGLKVVRTDARGYHDDLKQALTKVHIQSAVATISSDVPALTDGFLNRVISMYEVNRADALTVLVPVGKRLEMGLSTTSTYQFEGKLIALAGSMS